MVLVKGVEPQGGRYGNGPGDTRGSSADI